MPDLPPDETVGARAGGPDGPRRGDEPDRVGRGEPGGRPDERAGGPADDEGQPVESTEGRFSLGQEVEPETVEKEQVGDFAEGQRELPNPDEGVEQPRDEERFSEGQEELPENAAEEHVGDFAEGQRELPDPEDRRSI